jgi:hypothetical protein
MAGAFLGSTRAALEGAGAAAGGLGALAADVASAGAGDGKTSCCCGAREDTAGPSAAALLRDGALALLPGEVAEAERHRKSDDCDLGSRYVDDQAKNGASPFGGIHRCCRCRGHHRDALRWLKRIL